MCEKRNHFCFALGVKSHMAIVAEISGIGRRYRYGTNVNPILFDFSKSRFRGFCSSSVFFTIHVAQRLRCAQSCYNLMKWTFNCTKLLKTLISYIGALFHSAHPLMFYSCLSCTPFFRKFDNRLGKYNLNVIFGSMQLAAFFSKQC